MFEWMIQWLLSALVLLAVARFVPGFYLEGLMPAVIAAAVIGLMNAGLGRLAKFVNSPMPIVAFGFCLLGINAVTIVLASKILPGYDVEGFTPAVWGGLALTLLGFAIRAWVREA
jgi:putative membrane protein